ncbi:transporter [Scleromatobacter humisilvae]|uniref:Transporter n=1 Tax=Scleromatobacter humisilvae TaxID=2897159 RepID=A0A9X2C2E3_9BURK|nr:transporter [Scleromatobacter humisilvae]MCK9686734.1 transporter [Scleromatobacter humisilvae]
MTKIPTHSAFAAALLSLAAGSASACATCGCSLSTDAATGYPTRPGWSVSLQFDDIDQSQLRHGSRAVSTSAVAAINDAGGDQEVEHDTVNRYTTLGIAYAPNDDWGLRVLVPWVDRGHSTYASATNPVTQDQLSTAKIKGLGDLRLMATYQGLLEERNLGLQLGIKLPTGHYGGANADGTGVVGRHPATFRGGPLSTNDSPDNLVDTSLQPGTGTTDVIVGAYFHQAVATNIDAFVNAQYQSAFAQRLHGAGQDFRVGNTTFASFGARYEANPEVVPQLQVNVSHKSADQGALADNPDSAGTVVYLSPGVTGVLGDHVQAFAFVQLPVASHLVGYQLAPRWTGSAGVSYSF